MKNIFILLLLGNLFLLDNPYLNWKPKQPKKYEYGCSIVPYDKIEHNIDIVDHENLKQKVLNNEEYNLSDHIEFSVIYPLFHCNY